MLLSFSASAEKQWVYYPANCTRQWLELTRVLGCDPTVICFHLSPFINYYVPINGIKVTGVYCLFFVCFEHKHYTHLTMQKKKKKNTNDLYITVLTQDKIVIKCFERKLIKSSRVPVIPADVSCFSQHDRQRRY